MPAVGPVILRKRSDAKGRQAEIAIGLLGADTAKRAGIGKDTRVVDFCSG